MKFQMQHKANTTVLSSGSKKSCLNRYLKLLACSVGLLSSTAFIPSSAHAQNYLDYAHLSPYTKYKTFETEHFRFIYQEGYWDFTARAAEHIEHAHEVLSPILKWEPYYKTNVLIADNEDDANGSTMPALRVGIVLIATPPDGWMSTAYTDDWIKLLVFHEYTHFLNIDATRGLMQAARIFFGDIITPNGLWPTWMLEGLAVYYETRTSRAGRGRSPYYEGVLRAFLNENRLGTRDEHGVTLDRVNGPMPYFPGGEIPYLFGFQMWEEFSKDHSRYLDTDSAMGELSYQSSYRIPYFINGNLENVMGKTWPDYWESFIKSSELRLGAQIETVKKNGETPHNLLTHAQFSSYLGALSPDGQWLAYTETSLDDQAILVLINLKTKKTRRLNEKVLGVGMGFTPDSKHLIYSSLTRFDTYKLYSDLFDYDLEHHSTHQLTAGVRAKDPTVSPNGTRVVFVHSDKATNYLQIGKIEKDGDRVHVEEIRTLYTPAQFGILSTPRYLNDHEVVLSRQDIGLAQADLIAVDTDTGLMRMIYSDGAMNRHPGVQGGSIFFTSDKSGIENVYELKSGGTAPVAVSNVVGSLILPQVTAEGNLYASYLTSDGYEIADLGPSVIRETPEKVGPPNAPDTLPEAMLLPKTQLGTEEKSDDYSPWSSMAPRQWAPVDLINYNSYAGLSFFGTLLGFDTTGKQQYFGQFGYNAKPGTVDGSFSYTYYGFRPVLNFTASSLTTDIADDINHSQYRVSKQAAITMSFPIQYTFSSLVPAIYGFVDWNRVYDLNSHAPVAFGDFEYSRPMVPGFGASLAFSDAESTKLGFMSEEGNTFVIAAEDRVNVDHYDEIKYLASYTHYFDLGNHMVLEPRVKMLGSTYPIGYDHSYAVARGPNSTNIYDDGTGINLNQIGVRGYGYYPGFYTRQTYVGSLDYHFPLLKPFLGIAGTDPFFLKQLHGFIYAETAFTPLLANNRMQNLYLPSFGGGLTVDTQILVDVPISVNLQIQNGTQTQYGGETLFFLTLTGGSLF